MKRPDSKIADHIRDYGWHCLHVSPRVGETGASFTYTVGLHASYDHPELMIFGLDRDKSHAILTTCVDMIRSGTRFPTNEPVGNVLARDFKVMFRRVHPQHFGEYLGTAIRHYGHRNFGAFVLFWPDKEHRFVWESENLPSQVEAAGIVVAVD